MILFVLVCSVNAAKDNTTTLSQDTDKEINQEKISTESDDSSLNKEILKKNNENITLKEPVSGGTFNDIQTAINTASSGSIIELSGLYKGTTQLNIKTDNITFIGTNDATLDAQRQSRIMNIEAKGITLKNIKFINGNAEGDFGGVIQWNGANGNITNCNFNNNEASLQGSIILWNGANGIITNCNFTSNTANSKSGGAIRWVKSNGIITNCNFNKNTVNGLYGGAIYCSNSNVNIINCNFTNNRANNGGAIDWYGTNGNITNCNFIGNTAIKYHGGAIRWTGSNGTITNCNFNKNTAERTGGAIEWDKSNGTVTNCNFNKNTAKGNGSAINWDASNGTVTNCNFTNNTANEDGTIYCTRTNGIISNSIFKENKAKNYRNIYAKDDLKLYNSSLETIVKINQIPDFIVGSAASINITFDDGTNLRDYNITLFNNNESLKTFTYNSKNNYIYKWNNIAVGDYSITVGNINDNKNKFIAIYNPMKFTVTKYASSVSIDPISNVTYNNEVVVEFHVENKTNITITITNIKTGAKRTFNNYTGSEFRINDLAAGEYNITITNNGNENCTSSNDSALFNIAKASSKVNINSIINGTYKTENATVNFNILNSTTTQITICDIKTGSIVYNNINFIGDIFTIGNLTGGTYNITVTNKENENYTSSNDSALFNIAKIKLNPSDVNITVASGKGDVTVSIKGPQDFNGDIDVIINDTSFRMIVINGTGLQDISLTPGKYNLTGLNITNSQNYEDIFISENISFVVIKKDTIITAKDASFIINYGGQYTVSTNLGNGKTITLIINNRKINAITNANGIATFKLTKTNLAPAGKKTTTITFNGDENYTSKTINTKITVNKEKTKITGKSAKKIYKKTANKKLKIVLKSNTGKSLGKVKINLKAKKLKGKLGKKLKKGYDITVKFNKKGIGYITLKNSQVNGFKKGTYKFSITYKGSNTYKPSTSQIKMKIK